MLGNSIQFFLRNWSPANLAAQKSRLHSSTNHSTSYVHPMCKTSGDNVRGETVVNQIGYNGWCSPYPFISDISLTSNAKNYHCLVRHLARKLVVRTSLRRGTKFILANVTMPLWWKLKIYSRLTKGASIYDVRTEGGGGLAQKKM